MKESQKTTINNLLVQVSVISVKLNVLTSMVLGVASEMLPEATANTIYTNFVNVLEDEISTAFKDIDKILYDDGDLAFAARQRFQHLWAVQSMKNDNRYNENLNSQKKSLLT